MSDFLPPTLQAVEAAGHTAFIEGLYNLNIIGVRHPNPRAGVFDDRLHVVARDELGWFDRCWPITTDPSSTYMQKGKELNSKGTPYLQPGQHRGTYVIGLHKPGHEALIQDRPFTVKRVPPGAEPSIHSATIEDHGLFGMNIHASDPNPYDTEDRERGAGGKIYGWSAGCQVFANSSDFRAFMTLVHKSAALYGPRFTYTLTDEPR